MPKFSVSNLNIKTILCKPNQVQIFGYTKNSLFNIFIHIFQCSLIEVSNRIHTTTLRQATATAQRLKEWVQLDSNNWRRHQICFVHPTINQRKQICKDQNHW